MSEPRGKRLLILDDDPMIGQTIRRIAEFAGFDAKVAAHPDEFFRLLGDWRPGHIALDLIMPKMDGVEVMAELAKRRCGSRVIIISGVGSRILDAAGRSAREHGLNIAGILPKPFTPSALRELLKDDSAPPSSGTPGKEAPPADEAGERYRALGAADLERAILDDQLFVVYQPKVVCLTGVLAGFEALARWRHPELGEISPDFFIPLAEANGLIDALTRVVLQQALRWFGTFCTGPREGASAQDLSKLTLSINVSALSLNNQSLFDHLYALCEEVHIPPQRLTFELTETSAMGDPVTSLDLLTRLRMKGFHLSIDDFGTGFSSMLQLVRLPFSEIKVDRSFVASARYSSESRAVIKSITELGHSLGLQITAEGIEDEETLVYLRNTGCDHLQGYLIALPMTGRQVSEWLSRREPSDEEKRLAAVHALDMLDSEEEPRFDALVHLGLRLFNVPMAALSLVERDRVWFKSRAGIGVTQLPRNASFCTYAIESDDAFVVQDAHKDLRFSANTSVVGPPHIRFYAGQALHATDGCRVGALSLLDRKPREFSSREREALAVLARLAEEELRGEEPHPRDDDTGAYGPEAFEERAAHALSLCRCLGLPGTLLLFRQLNLEEGEDDDEREKKNLHKVAAFARLLAQALRSSDLIGRRSRDSFVVLLCGSGEKEREELRNRLERRIIEYNKGALKGLQLRFEMGCATTDSPAGEPIKPIPASSLRNLLIQAEAGLR